MGADHSRIGGKFRSSHGSRLLGFNKADEITITFCGSKKSLAIGVPMAGVIFAGQAIGAIVLPLMLFHQIQLMVCAVIAQKYASTAANGRVAHRDDRRDEIGLAS